MLAQENYENVMGRQVAAVLSTVPSLLLPTDVVRLVVKHLLPDELRHFAQQYQAGVTQSPPSWCPTCSTNGCGTLVGLRLRSQKS